MPVSPGGGQLPDCPQSRYPDYARLPAETHQQLAGPLVIVWDNLNTHLSRAMAEPIAAPLRIVSRGAGPQWGRDLIEAHLTIVFAALAVSRWSGRQTGSSIRRL